MSAGKVFCELDLDFSRFEKSQQKLLQSAQAASTSVEANWKNLGAKSDNIYAAMRASAENSYNMIKNAAGTSTAEIARAHEAMNAKIKAANEQQYGAQTSLLDSLKQNWMAFSATAVGAYMVISRVFSEGRGIASAAMEIGKMAQISGLSTDQFQKFAFAAKMSDVEAESLAVGIKRLAKNMEETSQGSGDAAKWFNVMGISVKDLSTGGLKPLDQMMGELADKFVSWSDGPRKTAIAMALFGRSGEALIPMLNKGSAGLTEFYREAERLGIVLSPDIVRKGQEAEGAFKRFEAQLHTFKLSLSPVVSELTKYLGVITDIISKGKEMVFPTIPKGPAYELKGEEKKLFSLWGIDVTKGGAAAKRTPELWELFGSESMAERAKLVAPPELPKEYPITKMSDDLWKSFKQGEGVIKIIEGDMVEMIPIIKGYESWWDKINEDLEKIRLQQKMVTPEGTKWGAEEPIGLKSGEMMLNGTIYDVKFWERITKEIEDLQLEFKKTIIPGTTGWEGAEPIGLKAGEMRMGGKLYSIDQYVNEMNKTAAFWDDITHRMGDSFSTNFIDFVNSGFHNLGDYLKKFGMDALSMMEKLILNAAIFGSITGEKNASGLYGGLVGGLFSLVGVKGYQEGGYVDRPQLAMLHGGEYVVPESKIGKGGGQSTVNYYDSSIKINRVDAVDASSFEQRFGGSIVNVVHKNKRLRGVLRE